MAGSATQQLNHFETHEALNLQPHLSVVPDPAQQPELINAVAVPELQFARERASQEAASIMARNRELWQDGAIESVPRPVDALGTVRQVVEAKRQYGAASPEYQKRFEGLMLDSERLLGEAYAKNTSEYFADAFQQFDQSSGTYFAHGLSIRSMVTNGLSPLVNSEEQARRQNEFVEERTYEAIGSTIARLGIHGIMRRLPEDNILQDKDSEGTTEATQFTVMTISECTDEALESYALDPKGSHGGYAPGINKFMVRGVSFAESGDRYEEQVAVPGMHITHEVITAVLAQKGAIAESDNPSKTEIHATQLISVTGDSAMDLVRDLDSKASEVTGKNIFMGEEVPVDHDKDYNQFVEDAEVRRKRLAPKPQELAEYLVTLEENDIDSRVAEVKVNEWLKKTLLEVASKNPDLAEAMFDKATADGFKQVAELKAQGLHREAQWLQSEVEKNAPEVEYCGAGGCGLEAANAVEAAKAKALGLEGNLLHDKQRACPRCNAMKVHYGNNGKACTGCGHNEIKSRPAQKAK